ncbi:MAG: C40 family peptidase [Sinimarinibacterium flocculans]|uniref:C40 family peptidase n=1 Tax=Sinimarinibacterium flocculans TaxID=985250 RepID=UPI003C6795D8
MTGWAAWYVGMPYADKGRGPEAFDCWGLVQRIYADQFGIDLPGFENDYPHSADRMATAAVISRECGTWSRVDRPRVGDVIVLAIGGRPCHCGIAVSATTMLHTLTGTAACIESLAGLRWRHRIEGIYRHAGML